VRVIAKRPDTIVGFGDTRIHALPRSAGKLPRPGIMIARQAADMIRASRALQTAGDRHDVPL
jgi:hypothetical protein